LHALRPRSQGRWSQFPARDECRSPAPADSAGLSSSTIQCWRDPLRRHAGPGEATATAADSVARAATREQREQPVGRHALRYARLSCRGDVSHLPPHGAAGQILPGLRHEAALARSFLSQLRRESRAWGAFLPGMRRETATGHVEISHLTNLPLTYQHVSSYNRSKQAGSCRVR